MSGGGSFSACLERAIRQQRKSPSLINSTGGGLLENIDEESATTSSSAPSANNDGGSTTNNDNELQNQDWSSHHVSYNILQECLAFFSRRRGAVKTAIRCNNGPTNSSTNNNNGNKKKVLSEAQLNSILHEYAQKEAPCLNDNVTEYAQQRALGKTPPRGYKDTTTTNNNNHYNNNNNRNSKSRSNIFLRSLCISCYSEEELNDMEDEESNNEVHLPYTEFNAASSSNNNNSNLQHRTTPTRTANSPPPPLNQMENTLTEAEIIKRLSFIERSELSAVLDSEVDRATTFYRHRLSELAPPRLDGSGGAGGQVVQEQQHGGRIAVGNSEFKGLLLGENDNNDDDNDILDIVESSPNQNQKYYQGLTFNDLGSEILELHAYITTNIIVIRQILIRYDAFVRSLGGSPMSSWYQKSRRIKGKHGRTSDYADLLSHTKLKRLTQAYISEYKSNLENDTEGLLGTKGSSSGNRRGKRFRGFAYQFHKLMDEMKERQRLKWRQPALDLHDSSIHSDDDNKQGGGGSGQPAVSSNDEDVNNANGGVEVAINNNNIPSPPLQPPDYANLRSNPDIGEDIEYQVYIFKCVQSKTQRSIEKTYSGRASGVRDNFIATLREYFLLGSALDNLSLMPEYLIMRGKSLKSSLLVVAQWRDARKANLYGIKRGPTTTPDDQSGGGESSWFGGFCSEPQPKASQSSSLLTHFGLLVNILGCFFYMMNYYIVGPSSVEYANYLGEADAMSGLIIGAMPWAALISAFMYSIWTNHSYRTPLLASGVLLIAGNALYSSAYRSGSVGMAICGRFLTGLGGPRSMNRRFIADTTPLLYRTAANAAFGTATALGAALGPAIAVALDNFDFQFTLPLYGSVYVNGMTGPGYFMSLLWVIYTMLMLLFFREPVRSGLKEQLDNERTIDGTASTIQDLPTIQTYPSEYEMGNLPRSSTTLSRGDSVVTNFERGDSVIEWARGDSVHTDDVDCATCPTENEIEFPRDGHQPTSNHDRRGDSFWSQIKFVRNHMTPAVNICMFLLFSKQFTVENMISATSMLTKNRYGWGLAQVGALGSVVGCLTIPISIFIGWISQYREDHVLMLWMISIATFGMALLVDPTDFVSTDNDTYNEGNIFAVGPHRYYVGYLIVFCTVQAFDGVVGSVLSKVIPTALASGTLNSGLLSTFVGTLGRGFGDISVTVVGFVDLRQIQNLLFVPCLGILAFDLILVIMNRETLSA